MVKINDSCLLSSPFSSKSAGDGGGGEVERLKSRIRKAGDHARVSTGWRILPLCQPLACMHCEGYICLCGCLFALFWYNYTTGYGPMYILHLQTAAFVTVLR